MSAAMRIQDENTPVVQQSPRKLIEWVVAQNQKMIVTTSFGPFSAVMLHPATRVKSDIPVIWVDIGYNTLETYTYAEALIRDLNLNIEVFILEMTAARRYALMNSIPNMGSDLHGEFTRQVKLEPFQRMLTSLKPDFWLTAIRKDETDFRKTLEPVSKGPKGITEVALFLNSDGARFCTVPCVHSCCWASDCAPE